MDDLIGTHAEGTGRDLDDDDKRLAEINEVGLRRRAAGEVRSDFQRGSFEISLILDQGIVEQAKQVLFGSTVIDAKGLVDSEKRKKSRRGIRRLGGSG